MRKTRGTIYETLLKLLIVSSVAILIKTANILPSVLWNKIVKTGSFDFIVNISIEECYILCWRTQQCKAINYLRHFPLCELNKFDPATDTVSLDLCSECFYSVKSQWAPGEISAMCTRRSKTQSECTKDGLTGQYCPKPNFVSTTEVIRGNLIGTGKKIRYACIISEAAKQTYSVGVSKCQDNGTWSDAWRPCREQDTWFQGMQFNVSRTQDEMDANAGNECGFFEGPIADLTENPITIQCRIPLVGRFVRVTAITGHIVIFCELEVYTRIDAPV